MLIYERAMKEDCAILNEIIVSAFKNEVSVLGSKPAFGEEPSKLLECIESRRVWKIMIDDEVIGCIVVYIPKVGFGIVNCIAIAPGHQNCGYGSRALKWIETQYRSVYQWHANVYDKNAGTRHFFEKNSYIKKSDDEIESCSLYEKCLNDVEKDADGGCLYRDLSNLGFQDEFLEDLTTIQNVRLERIISRGQTTPQDFWYDQDWTEVVLVVSGVAVLDIEGREIELRSGDWRCIHPHQKHRVIKTSQNPPCVWFAVHIQE